MVLPHPHHAQPRLWLPQSSLPPFPPDQTASSASLQITCVPEKILSHLGQDGGDVSTDTNAKSSDAAAEANTHHHQTDSEPALRGRVFRPHTAPCTARA